MRSITFPIVCLAFAGCSTAGADNTAESVEDCAGAGCDDLSELLQVGLPQTGLVHKVKSEHLTKGLTAAHINSSRNDSHLVEHVQSVLQHSATKGNRSIHAVAAAAKLRRTSNYMIKLDHATRRRRQPYRDKCLNADSSGSILFADCDSSDASQLFTMESIDQSWGGSTYCKWTSNGFGVMKYKWDSDSRYAIGVNSGNAVKMTLSWTGRRRTFSYKAYNVDIEGDDTRIGVELDYNENQLVQTSDTDTYLIFWDADTDQEVGGEEGDMPCE